MRILKIAAVALACAAARLCATDYYIDYANGTDADSGTSTAHAWQHCPGDPAATGNAAITTLAPGDVVRFKGGVVYVLTTAPGIELRWDGAAGKPITYDGNSDGTWGPGRARFTDHYSEKGIAAFRASSLRRHLAFRSLEIGPIGGAPEPPADTGGPVPARYGAGIAFTGGVEHAVIDRCVFRELGYWFNRRPMNATSIAGAGIASASSVNLRVADCAFSRVATACDFSQAGKLENVAVARCSFGEAIVWPVDEPPTLRNKNGVTVSETEVAADTKFGRNSWVGYGEAPQTALRIVGVDATVAWTVAAIGSPAPTFQWLKNGVPLAGATNATLRLERVALTDAGIYTAVATNTAGSTLSNAALLIVMPKLLLAAGGLLGGVGSGTGSESTNPPPPPSVVNVPPSFTLQPTNQLVARATSVSLNIAATGVPTPTFQWLRNGVPLAGATDAALVLSSVTSSDAGEYHAVATNAAGTASSRTAALTVLEPAPPPPPPSSPPPVTSPPPSPSGEGQATVLAAMLLPVGDAAASVEFAVSGSVSRTVLVRAVGPTLAAFRLVGPLVDPRLEIYRGTTRVAENDNWGGAAPLRTAGSLVSAFPITDGASADAAVLTTLAPGTYRAVITGNGKSGMVWVDAYDVP